MKPFIAALTLTFIAMMAVLYMARLNQSAAIILFPFFIIGTTISGNAHAPADWAVYLSLYVTLFAPIYLISFWVYCHNAHCKKSNDTRQP